MSFPHLHHNAPDSLRNAKHRAILLCTTQHRVKLAGALSYCYLRTQPGPRLLTFFGHLSHGRGQICPCSSFLHTLMAGAKFVLAHLFFTPSTTRLNCFQVALARVLVRHAAQYTQPRASPQWTLAGPAFPAKFKIQTTKLACNSFTFSKPGVSILFQDSVDSRLAY